MATDFDLPGLAGPSLGDDAADELGAGPEVQVRHQSAGDVLGRNGAFHGRLRDAVAVSGLLIGFA